jgi:hypothetical protein
MKLRALAAFVLVLLAAVSVERVSGALSQSVPPATKDKGTQTPSPPATTAETPALLVDDKHVESILGKQIISSSGETLGNVTDILVDGQGRVRAAIVDFGGFLGVGVRKLAVAWTALHFVQGKTALTAVLDMDKDQLRVAPEYRAGEPIVIVGAGQKPTQSSSPSAK